jgi:Uma2 family endonuclease
MVLSNRPEAYSAPPNDDEEDLELPVCPPSDLESDEPPLESTLHLKQLILLITCLEWLWSDRQDFFIGGNLTVYFKEEQLEETKFRGPDFFVALNTERRERKSWVVWAEGGKYPNLIVELLSDSTAKKDREEKKQVYQDIFRTPEYFWFHPNTLEFKGFRLTYRQYEEIAPNEQGWLWSEELQLYLGIFNRQLRFFTSTGDLVATPEEDATQARRQVEKAQTQLEAERQRAETERQRAERLLQKLRDAGIELD